MRCGRYKTPSGVFALKLVILTMKPQSHFVRSVSERAKVRGIETTVLDFKDLVLHMDGGVRLTADNSDITEAYDSCLARPLSKPTMSEFLFNISVLRVLRSNGTRVINPPEAYVSCSNKVLAYEIMARAGLPIPATLASQNMRAIKAQGNRLGENAVIKPVCGSRGTGVMYLSELAERRRYVSPLICQRFVRGSNYDVRALVVGDQVVAGMARVSNEVATNLSRGGIPTPLKLDRESSDLALMASTALGCDVCGVDIAINTDGQRFVLEVNSQPDFRGLQNVTDLDIPDRIVSFLEMQVTK